MRKGKGGSMLSAPQQQILHIRSDDVLPSPVILNGGKNVVEENGKAVSDTE